MAKDYEIREYREGDEEGIVACFNDVFGDAGDDGRSSARDLASWRWAFADNPAGRRVFVAEHAGRIVAQCAAWPMRALLDGRETVFGQGVDSMTHPEHRRGLKRPGLFVNTAQEFFARYGGVEADAIHYGLPIEQAFKMGVTFLKYEVVRTQTVLGLAGFEAPDRWPEEVERLDAFDEQLRWLFDRASGEFGAAIVRDAAHAEWRFSRPGVAYERLGVRDADGILRGLAIYRRGHLAGLDDVGCVCDWLVPPDEPEVGELLERALRCLAARDGVAGLAQFVPDWSHWFGWFQDRGWRVHPSVYTMCIRTWSRPHGAAWMRRHWWYTLADTDLV